MTSFRSIALASLLIVANAYEENHSCPQFVCNEDTRLEVSSYDMFNGANDNYLDDTYTGGSFAAKSSLTGGKGDLTDGVIATERWGGNRNGPYVGWTYKTQFDAPDYKIPITFKFTKNEIVSNVKISVEDPPPESSGGIGGPAFVNIGGIRYPFPANTSPQSGPYTASVQLNTPIYVSAGDPLRIELIPTKDNKCVRDRDKDGACVWVFLSEVQFFEPCSDTFIGCVDQERAKCCYKTDSGCGRRRELEENGVSKAKEDAFGVRNLFTSCLWGDDVYTKPSTDLCLEECFDYAERLCFINEEFGLLQECDNLWWTTYDGAP